jgi:hypothetical protein
MRGSSGVPITSPSHPNLLGMYTMDNISGSTLVDESVNGNDGTISAGVATATGHIGDALDFSANLANVSYPTGIITPAGSICFWAKVGSINNRALNASHHSTDGLAGVDVTTAGELIAFYLPNSAQTYHQVDSTLTGSTTGFSFYVATYDGTLTFYVDGTLSGKTQNAGSDINPWLTSMDSLAFVNSGIIDRVGADNNGDGLLDQLRVFDRVITQSEVTALYNGGTGA